MTTENTMTDAAPLTPEAVAEELVKSSTTTQLVETLVRYHKDAERNNERLLGRETDIANWRVKYDAMYTQISEFLKDHIGDKDMASVSELKDLAEALDIELKKTVNISFSMDVTVEMEVDLDVNIEDISENDFRIDIDFTGKVDAEGVEIDWTLENYECDSE